MSPEIRGRLKRTALYRWLLIRRQQRELEAWQTKGGRALPHLKKQAVLQRYAEQFDLATLIETGTHNGDMVFAMRSTFRQIFSIELGNELYRTAASRFARDPQIRILEGDSAQVLPEVLAKLEAPALFWLDGHYSAGRTARGEQDTPISAELEFILAHPVSGHVVLIDDARHFNGDGDYPTLEQLKERISERKPGWTFEVADDIVRTHAVR